MKKLVLFCLFVLLSINVFAKCGDNSLPSDKNYKYFMGKGYSDKSAQDAMDKAEQDFNSQIVRLFGVLIDTQNEYYSDENSISGTSRIKERSLGNTRIKGLDKFDEPQTTKENGSYIGYVCYKYPIKEYEAEKKRLENIKYNDKTNYIFNETVGDTDCIGTSVSIATKPEKAYVIIDDGKYQGQTPIKFGNICNGRHKLLIIKENYKDLNETLIVPSSKVIEKTLTKDSKEIKVTTSLGNSHIFINGVDRGIEPVKFNAVFGDNYEIEGQNSEAIPVKRTMVFYKDSADDFEFKMDLKPASIDFSAFKKLNPGVRIYFDGEEVKKNKKNSLSANYEYDLVFKKNNDFYDIQDSIILKGGETTYYPAKRLEFSKTPTKILKAFGGMGGSVGNNIWGIDLLHFGLDFKYKYLYLGGGVTLFNYSDLPEAKFDFDYKYYSSIRHVENDLSLQYREYGYINIGFNINNDYSVFGVASIGSIEYSDSDFGKRLDNYNLYIEGSGAIKSITRYGFGLQYFPDKPIKKDNKNWGLRLTYLTGNSNISLEDISKNIIWGNGKKINIIDGNLDFPKKINTIGITALFNF